ncbi:MAG: LPS assembly protein LptD, partial [Candidatus Obscuribacterales bacterium]|nr:LPS assembly protein LptD [Steroidobacteraceae bacterium]
EAWSTGSNGTERSPTRSLPIFSVDSGVVFERSSGRTGQRVQTLEPRILYLFVPYRNQDALPIFDTVRPDLNLIQLFSTNRYVGGDRVGDANQLAYGVTSRLLDANDGQQYLAATLGQTVRYRTPRVTLPGEIPGAYDRSDVIGELALTAYRHWNAKIGVQWDSYTKRSARSEFAFQYRPENGKVLNAGYRYRNSSVANIAGFEQADASFAWPIGTNFSSYGGLVYKLQDNSFTEQFAGLEYRSCCWNMRLVVGRSIVTRDGDYDTWFEWQFELKGLSSVGKAGSFLADKIRGYSAAF